ncbi:MAG TPA: FHA domain-containing protein [Fimbriimonadaceae bacterium]|nr:FHA domain-containing protein [Fimbriimonadaceae bacterium]HRJ97887.1 FHA domain-containing protein [Fimbriimonadaceae bacterium]
MGRIFLLMLAGAIAGLLAWIIVEPQFPTSINDPAWGDVESRFIGLLGGLIGLFVGGTRGWMQGSKVHALRGGIVGLVLGVVGGYLGYRVGGGIVDSLFGPGVFVTGRPLPVVMTARVLAIMPMGLILGAALGAASLSARQVGVGLVGGALGAGVGAAVFDLIGEALGPTLLQARGVGNEVGGVSRAITAVCIGGGIGLFTGIMERATRQAWLRLVLGRNEGKEWLVDAPQTFLGRSERAHVPLFGDPNIMPMHATIVRQSGRYILYDGGSPMGTGLNGQRIGQAELASGDMINIGGFNLLFLMRSGRAQRIVAAERFVPQPVGGPQGAVGPIALGAVTAAPTVASVRVPTLVAMTGPLAGQRFEVVAAVEVGRESGAIPLGFDQGASRRHALLTPGPAGVVVSDLNSTNGTLVNGKKVQSQTLSPGDTLQIGSTVFRLE